MLESGIISDKKLHREIHRVAGEVQLQQYGKFLDEYNKRIAIIKKKLPNKNNIRLMPVVLNSLPEEDAQSLKLINSDNKLLSRILVSLVAICEEIKLLVAEARNDFYPALILYSNGENNSGFSSLCSVSNLIEKLQAICFFVSRCREVIILLMKQLCSILGKGLYSASSCTCFPEPLDCLGELLVSLLTLDCLLCEGLLKDHWMTYRRTVRSLLHNPAKFELPLEKLRSLEKCLVEIEAKLLTGQILQKCIESCFDDQLNNTMKSCNLANEFAFHILHLINELDKDDENIAFTQIWLQSNAMFVFYYSIFGNTDKRIYRRLCDTNKKLMACTLYGNVMWYPETFLKHHLPILTKNLDAKSLANARVNLIATRTQNLHKDMYSLSLQTSTWVTQIEKICRKPAERFSVRQLNGACDCLIDALKLSKKISELVKWIANIHANESRPMTKSVLFAIYQLIETLKTFQFVFYRNTATITKLILLIYQLLTHKSLSIIHAIKRSLTQERSYKKQQLDVLSSLNLVEHVFKGPQTNQRVLIIKLGLSASGLSNEALYELRTVVNRIELIANVRALIDRLCNCSFLYWYQVLLPTYFAKLIECRTDITRAYTVLNALSDSLENPSVTLSLQRIINNDLLDPLNQLLETNLRLQTHLDLKLPRANPFVAPPPSTFAKLYPALFGQRYVHAKAETEHYLSTTFYNLTTVVLHDWRTYGEMRRLARLQYNLHTVEDNLPMQTLDQGLDVLEIMRNIHIFVGKYLYNLNNQIFVEERSNNKHLNTINISHVANSIRTHGIGIMNTTVNFTYQFLQNKFFIFSQFLFDEQIKSRLLKDLRFFVEHKSEINQSYPYERAEKFNVGIRKLGLNEEGSSYLDLFRKLITQIGNAMGYIRLIRSGGRRCLADATCFIPDLKGIDDLDAILQEDLSQKVKEAIHCFKQNVNNLVDNFEEATEYFKLLVNVFAPALRNPQHIHLRNFYIIVPPLTVNFVEHLLLCKDRLSKKNRDQAAFTDDGFPIGLAYIVELLDQTSQLKTLHWFQSVKSKHARERQQLEMQKIQASKEDQKLQQTLALTEMRLNAVEKEFKLFFYSFNSAHIFFKC